MEFSWVISYSNGFGGYDFSDVSLTLVYSQSLRTQTALFPLQMIPSSMDLWRELISQPIKGFLGYYVSIWTPIMVIGNTQCIGYTL